MNNTLLDYPSTDVKGYNNNLSLMKKIPSCPWCFTKKLKPFQDKGLYVCDKCIKVFKPK